jgi:hypothetical protein
MKDYKASKRPPRPDRVPLSQALVLLDCAARACYNRIDTSNRREFAVLHPACQRREGESMKNPLDSLWGTVISGLILTVILYFVVKSILS